jgi:hypothetical protein
MRGGAVGLGIHLLHATMLDLIEFSLCRESDIDNLHKIERER